MIKLLLLYPILLGLSIVILLMIGYTYKFIVSMKRGLGFPLYIAQSLILSVGSWLIILLIQLIIKLYV